MKNLLTLSLFLFLSFILRSQNYVGFDSSHYSLWNADIEAYDPESSKLIYFYNDLGLLDNFETWSLDSTGVMQLDFRGFNKYNDDKIFVESETYSRDENLESLYLSGTYLALLNSNNTVDSIIRTTLNVDGSVRSLQTEKRLYEEDFLSVRTLYAGDQLNQTLDNRFLFEYDTLGRLIDEIYQDFDSMNEVWTNKSRVGFTYNSANQRFLRFSFRWNSNDMVWDNSSRIETHYNQEGFRIGLTSSGFNQDSNRYILSSRSVYEIDEVGNILIIFGERYNRNNEVFQPFSKREYFYSILSSNQEEFIEKVNVNVYPNPVQEFINISNIDGLNLECKLFNSNGQLLQSNRSGQRIININIQDYPPGIYYFRIRIIGEQEFRSFTLVKI